MVTILSSSLSLVAVTVRRELTSNSVPEVTLHIPFAVTKRYFPRRTVERSSAKIIMSSDES